MCRWIGPTPARWRLQVVNWRLMKWMPGDTRWLGWIWCYATNADNAEAEYVGSFNAGQKLYFWAIVASSFVFLSSGRDD
jgi:cytochrome b subunit of formate dehydrogenase